ncbi:hypothetical protein Tco_0321850 [Tanacetum coccineum]
MSMMGKMPFFLRLQVSQNPRGIFINQFKYALEMLKRYGLENSDVIDTPMVQRSKLDEDLHGTLVDPTRYRSMVGSLMYFTASRPDLVLAICMSACFRRCTSCKLPRFKKKYFGKCTFFGGKASQLVIQETNYGFNFKKIPLYCVSKSEIALSCNTGQHSRTKHIVVRYHFIKEQIENEIIELYFVKTTYQLADIFTKALGRERFEFLLNRLGMQSITPEELKSFAKFED